MGEIIYYVKKCHTSFVVNTQTTVLATFVNKSDVFSRSFLLFYILKLKYMCNTDTYFRPLSLAGRHFRIAKCSSKCVYLCPVPRMKGSFSLEKLITFT